LFILEVIGFDNKVEIGDDYFTVLAAAAISAELIRQDQYTVPCFEEHIIYELLRDRDDHEYNLNSISKCNYINYFLSLE